MTLRFAVLGLLAERPRTGYQLARRMERSTDYYWTARHSQIYGTLAALEAAGQVVHTVLAGPGPRDNKAYTPTAAGLDALRAWLTTPTAPRAERDEFVLKVSNLWLLPPDEAIAMVRAHRDEHAERLARYLDFEAESKLDNASAAMPEFATYATLRAGVGYERHRIAWCDWLLDELDRRTRGHQVHRSRTGVTPAPCGADAAPPRRPSPTATGRP